MGLSSSSALLSFTLPPFSFSFFCLSACLFVFPPTYLLSPRSTPYIIGPLLFHSFFLMLSTATNCQCCKKFVVSQFTRVAPDTSVSRGVLESADLFSFLFSATGGALVATGMARPSLLPHGGLPVLAEGDGTPLRRHRRVRLCRHFPRWHRPQRHRSSPGRR